MYNKAFNQLEKGNYKKSLEIYDYLLSKNYEIFHVLTYLIILYDHFNDLDTLLNRINELLLDSNYDYNILLFKKGNILYLQNKYDDAIECFNEVLENDPDNSGAKFYIKRITDKRNKSKLKKIISNL